MKKVAVILNPRSGSLLYDSPEEAIDTVKGLFEKQGCKADIHLLNKRKPLCDLADELFNSGVDCIVAGGGDGTVGEIALRQPKDGPPLGILPLGTLNQLAKHLNIPEDLEGAVEVICQGKPGSIDAGEVNGLKFFNSVVTGIYTLLPKYRESNRGVSRWKLYPMALGFIAKTLYRHSPFYIEFDTPEKKARYRTLACVITNNPFSPHLGELPQKDSLSTGKLGAYISRHSGLAGVFKMSLEIGVGLWHLDRKIESFHLEDCQMNFIKPKKILVMIDGEFQRLKSPLKFRSIPGALKVIMPE